MSTSFAFRPHGRLPRYEQAAYHSRTTNEACKKTHPSNSEETAT
jgi:hypothetical protein